jgi:hypothetical protein
MSFKFDITNNSDDTELRELIGKSPMTGAIKVAFLREPNFFRAGQVYGQFTQTFSMRQIQTGLLAGMGTRAIKSAYVNGRRSEIGYLCNLRILPEHQKSSGLARGYNFLRELHSDNRAKLYLTTIIEGNSNARNILESGRSSLPAYHDIGRFSMHALRLKENRELCLSSLIDTRCATPDDIGQIVEFLNAEGSRKQFFPEYRHGDFESKDGILLGLQLEDIYLAFDGDRLVGVTAAWDQTAFRQNMIAGYSRLIRAFRPFVNVGLGLLGYPILPKSQTVLNYFSLALVCIKDNDADTFSALLNTIISERKDRYSFMIGGFHENDPLLGVLKENRGISYSSRIYVVCWEDGEQDRIQLDSRIPYLELGAL